MHTRHPDETAPVQAPDGTRVRELGGNAAGGLAAHSVAHITLPPKTASARHYHPVMEESYIVLAGDAHIEIGDEIHAARIGDMIAIPPLKPHRIINHGEEPVVFLAICTPPWTPDCSVFE